MCVNCLNSEHIDKDFNKVNVVETKLISNSVNEVACLAVEKCLNEGFKLCKFKLW